MQRSQFLQYTFTLFISKSERPYISEAVHISEFGKEYHNAYRWLETEGVYTYGQKPHASVHLCHVLVYCMEESLFFHRLFSLHVLPKTRTS